MAVQFEQPFFLNLFYKSRFVSLSLVTILECSLLIIHYYLYSMLRTVLLVGIGGFLGSVSRFLAEQGLHRYFDTVFPIGTMTVNIVGSFIIGIVYAVAERDNLVSPEMRMFLAVGFCGGFTTFSSFAFDNLNLLKDSGFLYLSLYVAGSVFLGLLAVYFGTQVHKLF